MMPTTLEELNDDHRRMAYLLDLLERELTVIDAGGIADFDLSRSIMAYMSRYPDAVHHPKEELVFVWLRELDVALVDTMDKLESEHAKLAELGDELMQMLTMVVDGAMVERQALHERGAAYVALLRSHMRLEGDVVFPAAERVMTEAAWLEVANVYAQQQDPLFGPIVDEDFRSLFQLIRRDENDPSVH